MNKTQLNNTDPEKIETYMEWINTLNSNELFKNDFTQAAKSTGALFIAVYGEEAFDKQISSFFKNSAPYIDILKVNKKTEAEFPSLFEKAKAIETCAATEVKHNQPIQSNQHAFFEGQKQSHLPHQALIPLPPTQC